MNLNYEQTAIAILAVSALAAIGFWSWLVAVPVVRSFNGSRDRTLAVVASFYTLLSALLIGAALAGLAVYNWDRLAG